MDIEHRVKILEDELKILKNQIQNTLLDIQGELTDTVSADRRAALPSGGRKGAPPDEETGESAFAGAAPQAPTARSGQANVREGEAPATYKATVVALTPSPSQPADLTTFARVLTWVKATVGRVGSEAIRQALDVAASSGQLSAVMRTNLQTLLPPADGRAAMDIGEVLSVYLELNGLLSRDPQLSEAVGVMEARNGG